MRKVLIVLTALMLSSGLAVAQSAQGDSHGKGHAAGVKSGGHHSDAGGVKDAVKKMEDELREGTLKNDPSASEKYLADDYHTISGANGQAYSKQQVIDRMKSGAVKYSQISVSNEDVAIFGNNLVISHGEADVKLKIDGKDGSGKYHFARTWLKRNGKWQAVWFQSTKMQ